MIPLALADGPEALMRLRLDTRQDLVEARVLYARHGFREVEPFNTGRYADHWLENAPRLGTHGP
jgi:hypothetical protein